MSEPCTLHTYKLYLEGGAIVTVEARSKEAAVSCARREWRRDIGGAMPDVIHIHITGTRRVIVGDLAPRLIEATVPA